MYVHKLHSKLSCILAFVSTSLNSSMSYACECCEVNGDNVWSVERRTVHATYYPVMWTRATSSTPTVTLTPSTTWAQPAATTNIQPDQNQPPLPPLSRSLSPMLYHPSWRCRFHFCGMRITSGKNGDVIQPINEIHGLEKYLFSSGWKLRNLASTSYNSLLFHYNKLQDSLLTTQSPEVFLKILLSYLEEITSLGSQIVIFPLKRL